MKSIFQKCDKSDLGERGSSQKSDATQLKFFSVNFFYSSDNIIMINNKSTSKCLSVRIR